MGIWAYSACEFHHFLLLIGSEATGLRPSSSSFRARVRVKCLLIGAHDQDDAVAMTETMGKRTFSSTIY